MQPIDSKGDKQDKTMKFVKRAALLWCVFILLSFLITMFANNLENTKTGDLLLSLNGIRMLDKISKRK